MRMIAVLRPVVMLCQDIHLTTANLNFCSSNLAWQSRECMMSKRKSEGDGRGRPKKVKDDPSQKTLEALTPCRRIFNAWSSLDRPLCTQV